MTVNYTSLLKLGQPVTGTEPGTWGDVVNQQITTPLDQSIAGTVSLTSMTDADYTLTNGNGNNANEARYMALLVPSSLTLTAGRNIIVPNTSKMYIVQNSTTGTSAVTVKTSGGSGVAVPKGSRALLYCDGANNVVDAFSYISGSVTGVTAAAKDATTLLATNAFVDRLRSLLSSGVTSGAIGLTDRGCLVAATAGVTIPNSTFSANDVVTIYNNSASNITITASITTLRLAGTATTGNRTLAQRGIATVTFISGTEAVISGAGLS